jgi:hypothetical protein
MATRHELANRTSCRLLHRDAFGRGPFPEGVLFGVGQSKRHRHGAMVSI